MYPSALELAIRQILLSGRRTLLSHDRGVILGIMLALTPLPPLPFFGFIINLVNRALLRRGRLAPAERGAIQFGLLMSSLNMIVSIILTTLLIRWARTIAWMDILSLLPHALTHILPGLGQTATSPGVTTL